MLWFRFHNPSSPLMFAVTNSAGCFGDLALDRGGDKHSRIRWKETLLSTERFALRKRRSSFHATRQRTMIDARLAVVNRRYTHLSRETHLA